MECALQHLNQYNCRLLNSHTGQTVRPAKHICHNVRLGLHHKQNGRQQRYDGLYVTAISLMSLHSITYTSTDGTNKGMTNLRPLE